MLLMEMCKESTLLFPLLTAVHLVLMHWIHTPSNVLVVETLIQVDLFVHSCTVSQAHDHAPYNIFLELA